MGKRENIGQRQQLPSRKPPEQRLTEAEKNTRERRRRRLHRKKMIRRIVSLLLCLVIIAGVGFGIKGIPTLKKRLEQAAVSSPRKLASENISTEIQETAAEETFEEKTDEEEELELTPVPELAPDFHPAASEDTTPSNRISYTEVMVGDEILSDRSQYKPFGEFDFGLPQDYSEVEGIVTFRGNNFRDSAAFGTASFTENQLTETWSVGTGMLTYNGNSWTGSGWTGQPLMEKWPQNVKQHMNMYDWAKEKEDLVEVIYATMDGYVYFLDLETGEATRDKMYLGFTFKGAGALDPRGYPILYVGAGINSNEGTARVFIVNLLDCSVMKTFGNDDSFALRYISFFDSSCLVDAESDTMIYPGENGILYLMKLNTSFDPDAGTLSINPDPMVRWHYYGNRSDNNGEYWLGMEDSCAIYKGYLFVADNGGHLMCLNLKTLELVWVQDILDDSNSTPVLALEDGHLYLYISTSFHLGWRSSYTADVPIWKIDAENGEIVWKTSYECYSEDGVSGGVQSTIAVGKQELEDYIYVTVSKTGGIYDGVLTCINRQTGEVQWEHTSAYAWSSPVCVYDEEGHGRVIYCNSIGKMYLLDGITGETLDALVVTDSVIEASPAVYNNQIVVGTRGCEIKGIEIH